MISAGPQVRRDLRASPVLQASPESRVLLALPVLKAHRAKRARRVTPAIRGLLVLPVLVVKKVLTAPVFPSWVHTITSKICRQRILSAVLEMLIS